MSLAIGTISNVQVNDAVTISVQLDVTSTWGHSYSEQLQLDLSNINPSQVVNALKQRIVTWARSPAGGEVPINNSSVWLFGVPS